MIRLIVAASLATALGGIAAPAFAFMTQNNQQIGEIGDGQFEVKASPGQGPSVSWCAAGDYVIQGMGLPGTTRIWRVTPPPRRTAEGVGFALNPEGAVSSGLILFGAADDGSLSAASAQALCWGLNDID